MVERPDVMAKLDLKMVLRACIPHWIDVYWLVFYLPHPLSFVFVSYPALCPSAANESPLC